MHGYQHLRTLQWLKDVNANKHSKSLFPGPTPLSTPDIPETHWATKISSLSPLKREADLRACEAEPTYHRSQGVGSALWLTLISLKILDSSFQSSVKDRSLSLLLTRTGWPQWQKQLFLLDLPGVKSQGGLLPLTAEKLQMVGLAEQSRAPPPP